MKITIDTKDDSKEEMQHVIDLLQRIVSGSSGNSVVESSQGSDFNADMNAMSGFANMMNSSSDNSTSSEAAEASETAEEKQEVEEEAEDPQIQLY
jgi:hypothetical protein